MYQPAIDFCRTAAEKANQRLSWGREDKAFFASGACHILAFAFKSLHPTRNLEIVKLTPKAPHTNGTHVFVRDGMYAFDFNGWTKEKDLLEISSRSYQFVYPEWQHELSVVDVNLETFCKNNNHRQPACFLEPPWERAYKYIANFDDEPPTVTKIQVEQSHLS